MVTEESIKAITRDDVVAFHKAYYQPGRALVTVVGDMTAGRGEAGHREGARGVGRRAVSGRPSRIPPAAEPKPTTIFLVDKPGAAQSTFAIGRPGPPRNTPDYYALQVMNTMLGGMFQSRLNANIREEKGYSYGVGSSFAYGRGPGAVPHRRRHRDGQERRALVEFMKELKGILGARPVTDDELGVAKDALIQRLPATFASVTSINSALTTLWTQALPDDYYQQYAKKIAAITRDDVVRVAKKYIDVDQLAIVIVGDRKAIEAPLKAADIAPIVHYDIEGDPVK